MSANGIDAKIYGNTLPWNSVGQTRKELNAVNNITGNFGLQFGADVYPSCGYYPYSQGMAQIAQQNRENQVQQIGFQENQYKQNAGF